MDNGLSPIGMVYDFVRRAYDTDWFVTLSGTPSVVGEELVLGAAESTMMSIDVMKGLLEFGLTINESPDVGVEMAWGWKASTHEAYAMFRFDPVSGGLLCEVQDETGTIENLAIDWDPTWNGVKKHFGISWDSSGFSFFIDHVRMGKVVITPMNSSGETTKTYAPFLENVASASNMELSYIAISGAQTMFHIESNFDEN